jgi:hypothetical protein
MMEFNLEAQFKQCESGINQIKSDIMWDQRLQKANKAKLQRLNGESVETIRPIIKQVSPKNSTFKLPVKSMKRVTINLDDTDQIE